jgi:hypothetical protein
LPRLMHPTATCCDGSSVPSRAPEPRQGQPKEGGPATPPWGLPRMGWAGQAEATVCPLCECALGVWWRVANYPQTPEPGAPRRARWGLTLGHSVGRAVGTAP